MVVVSDEIYIYVRGKSDGIFLNGRGGWRGDLHGRRSGLNIVRKKWMKREIPTSLRE